MKEEVKAYGELTKLVADILLILGSVSIVFYFSGLINYKGYFAFFGIKSFFLDFQYYDYLLKGLVVHILLVVYFFPYLTNWIRIHGELNKITNDILRLQIKNPKNNKSIASKIKTSKLELLKEVEDARFRLTRDKYPLVLSLFIITFVLFAIYTKNRQIAYSLVPSAIGYIEVLLYEKFANKFARSKDPFFVVTLWLPMIFICLTIFIVPWSSGYIEAYSDYKSNNFDKYKLIMNSNAKTEYVNLLYSSKDQYFFLLRNELFIVPKQEIKTLLKY